MKRMPLAVKALAAGVAAGDSVAALGRERPPADRAVDLFMPHPAATVPSWPRRPACCWRELNPFNSQTDERGQQCA